MALLKYTPQFIERQYIPTQDVGLIANMIGQREKEYEKAIDTQQQALSEAYGMKSTRGFEAGRNQFVENLKSQLDKAIESRGGDAGAAIRDIQDAIIRAKNDPFIRTNEEALDQAKRLQDSLDRNPRLRVLNDPRSIQYREGLSSNDLAYKTFDPESVTDIVSTTYGNLGKQSRESGLRMDPKTGYLVSTTTKGLTNVEINKMKNDPSVRSAVMSKLGIDEYMTKDPKLAEEINGLIDRGIEGLSGGYSNQYIQPIQPVKSSGRVGEKYGAPGTGTLFMPTIETDSKSYKEADANAKLFESMLGSDGNVDTSKPIDPNDQIVPESIAQINAGLFDRGYAQKMLNKTRQIEEKNYNKSQWDAYKSQYESLYEAIKKKPENNSDRDFIEKVTEIEKNKAAIAESRLVIDDKAFSEDLITGKVLPIEGTMFYEIKHGKKTNDGIGFADFNKKFKDSGLTYTKQPISISPQGELTIHSPDGMEYAINKNTLPAQVRYSLDEFGSLYNDYFNAKLNKEKINEINKKTYNFGSIKVGLKVNPNDPSEKVAIVSYINPETGSEETFVERDLGNVYDNLASDINNVISRGR